MFCYDQLADGNLMFANGFYLGTQYDLFWTLKGREHWKQISSTGNHKYAGELMDSGYRGALLIIKPLIHVLVSWFVNFWGVWFVVPFLSIVHIEWVLFFSFGPVDGQKPTKLNRKLFKE